MRGKFFRRVAPFVAFVAVLTQGNLGWAGKTTTTTSLYDIVDGMSVDQDLVLTQKDGMGTLGVHADSVPVSISIGMAPEDCSNSGNGEPVVTLSGSLSHGPAKMRMRVQTSAKPDAGQYSSSWWEGSANFTMTLPEAVGKELPKQPVRSFGGLSGVGGNPYVYIQFKGPNRSYPYSGQSWMYLGRCVQGSSGNSTASLNLPGRRFLRLASSSCTTTASNVSLRARGGPKLSGRIAFTNQRVDLATQDPSVAVHYSGTLDYDSATVGISFTADNIAESWGTTGSWAGGNPAFGAQFAAYGDSSPSWSTTVMMGRCKDLAGTLSTTGTVDIQY